MGMLVSDWTSRRGLISALLVAAAILLLIKLYDPARFYWAGRVLAGIIALAYVWYLCAELAAEGLASLSPGARGASAFKAILGILIIGIPSALYAIWGRWSFRKGEAPATEFIALQRDVCHAHLTAYAPCDPSAKVGISSSALRCELPLNGLRHPPAGDRCGWYIWGGTEFSTSPEFFKPMHVHHLAEERPEVLPYLALPPGWRFRITPESEDIWFDHSLLEPERDLTSR
ncbi:MAG TPA: hypothetical protein VGQ76_05115 [Thermoanaerobaculia bacterium]|jgi:hypothetical protein|nr:hypothetical protein [Thermoanaerobaculia bacterium]